MENIKFKKSLAYLEIIKLYGYEIRPHETNPKLLYMKYVKADANPKDNPEIIVSEHTLRNFVLEHLRSLNTIYRGRIIEQSKEKH